MTAKKMADIFFGKFSETISPQKETSNNPDQKLVKKKELNKKINLCICSISN